MMDKAKVLKIRDNADRLLKKMEQDEKNQYEKVALSFSNSQATIDQILRRIEGDKTLDQLSIMLKGLKGDLESVITNSKPDFAPIQSLLQSLLLATKQKSDFTDGRIVESLSRIESGLNQKQNKQTIVDRTDELLKAINNIKMASVEFPESIAINNFPPQKVPQPVTNININPLRGFIHTTAVTVSTTLTTLPSYGVLANRRSIILYNNGTNTIFIGGSDVTSSNGLPIPAGTYSPPIDAGPKMILYGVTGSGTADCRVMEVSNDAIGG